MDGRGPHGMAPHLPRAHGLVRAGRNRKFCISPTKPNRTGRLRPRRPGRPPNRGPGTAACSAPSRHGRRRRRGLPGPGGCRRRRGRNSRSLPASSFSSRTTSPGCCAAPTIGAAVTFGAAECRPRRCRRPGARPWLPQALPQPRAPCWGPLAGSGPGTAGPPGSATSTTSLRGTPAWRCPSQRSWRGSGSNSLSWSGTVGASSASA